jgi:hypothetical protein
VLWKSMEYPLMYFIYFNVDIYRWLEELALDRLLEGYMLEITTMSVYLDGKFVS